MCSFEARIHAAPSCSYTSLSSNSTNLYCAHSGLPEHSVPQSIQWIETSFSTSVSLGESYPICNIYRQTHIKLEHVTYWLVGYIPFHIPIRSHI